MRKLNSKNKLLILGLSIFTFLVLSAVCVFIIFKIKDYNVKYDVSSISYLYNKDNKSYEELLEEIKPRMEFTILNCGYNCKYALDKLPLRRNKAILENIISLGMMDKYEKIINNCNCKDKKNKN